MTTIPGPPILGPGRLPAAIFRRWTHSREEDRDGIAVYRPSIFPFPPSFGRDGFELSPTGQFIQYDIAPNDGTVAVRGRWASPGGRRVAVSFPAVLKRPGFTFEVVALDDSVLRIRYLADRRSGARLPLDEADLESLKALPAPTTSRVIAYDKAEIVTLETNPARLVLRVTGVKPLAKMTVKLTPLVYVRKPEYWEIEVVGTVPGIVLPKRIPYTVSLALAGTVGSRGIQVIGANRSDRFDLRPGQPPVDQ